MITATVEDYLKCIYLAQESDGRGKVSMGRLAGAVGVVPGTATTMVRSLAEAGLVAYEKRTGVRLTPRGRKLATHVVRRHRLVELFLVQILGLDWSQVHEEAERLEHAISERVLEAMDRALGRPAADPHGDPIPSHAGKIKRVLPVSLFCCAEGKPVRIVRVLDQNRDFLEFLRQQRLTPGAMVTVESRHEQGDAVTLVYPDKRKITLGRMAADKILVQL